jgi:hypothetical protein
MNGATVTGMQLASQQQCVCVVLSDLSMTHEDTVKDPPPESTWTRAIWESLTFVDLATIGEGGVSPRKMRFRVDVFCFIATAT